MGSQPKLIVIVGETASGKSALALKIAKDFNGEIISADSRTIYKGMDIGTAKPSPEEQKAVRHWGLDLIEPNQSFSAFEFKNYALNCIEDIQNRGKLPILVGGTGLYIDSVLYDYQFSQAGAERDPQNPRHLKKTDEPFQEKTVRPDALVIGLQVSREELKKRVTARVEKMLRDGFIEETSRIADLYGLDCNALLAPGYKAFRDYAPGRLDLETAKTSFIKNDLDLAKRQRTWFKRNRHINWFNSSEDAYLFVEKTLANN